MMNNTSAFLKNFLMVTKLNIIIDRLYKSIILVIPVVIKVMKFVFALHIEFCRRLKYMGKSKLS